MVNAVFTDSFERPLETDMFILGLPSPVLTAGNVCLDATPTR
jgi:hypothetical protein